MSKHKTELNPHGSDHFAVSGLVFFSKDSFKYGNKPVFIGIYFINKL